MWVTTFPTSLVSGVNSLGRDPDHASKLGVQKCMFSAKMNRIKHRILCVPWERCMRCIAQSVKWLEKDWTAGIPTPPRARTPLLVTRSRRPASFQLKRCQKPFSTHKVASAWSWPLTSNAAVLYNAWLFTSCPLYAFNGLVLRHRGYFTLSGVYTLTHYEGVTSVHSLVRMSHLRTFIGFLWQLVVGSTLTVLGWILFWSTQHLLNMNLKCNFIKFLKYGS
jgi:hypothetical protein